MRIVRKRIRKARAHFVTCARLPFMPRHGSAQKIVDVFGSLEVRVWSGLEFRVIGYAARRLFDLRQPRRARVLPVLNQAR